MQRIQVLGSALALLLVAACNPAPVDENADFTITGKLLNAAGVAPAPGTQVQIFKVDSVWSKESNFLQYLDMEQDLAPNATFTATTDALGGFSIVLKGAQVNTAGGGGAAYLSVVYFDGGSETYLATASDWGYFTNANPEWDVGTLKLWDGGTATQAANSITFSWAANRAPTGNTAVTEIPAFMFAWDSGSTDALPKWAVHTFDSQVVVPRAAFKNVVGSPDFFVTAFSKEGSRYFQHRSSLHSNTVTNWTQNGEGVNLVGGAADLFEGVLTSPFSGNQATDGQIETIYDFSDPGLTDILIDLGGNGAAVSFSHVLLYDLVVRYYGDAVISVFGCTTLQVNTDSANCGTQVGTSHTGDWEFTGEDAFVYLAVSPAGASAEWLRVSVRPKGASGSPYFDAVSEIRVVQ